MKKYTATFTCDRYLWDEFKTWARSINSSASEQLSKFMKSALNTEVEPTTKDYIDTIIDQRIEKFVDERLNDLIDRRYMFGIKEPLISNVSSSNTDNTEASETDAEDTDNTDNTEPKSNSTDNTDNTNTSNSPETALTSYLKENYNNTDNTDNTDSRTTENSSSGTKARKRKKPTTKNQQYYLDREVAEIEGLRSYTVKRYRIGERNPQDKTFFERWQLDNSGDFWQPVGEITTQAKN